MAGPDFRFKGKNHVFFWLCARQNFLLVTVDVVTMNGAISCILGAEHGVVKRNGLECPSKSLSAPRMETEFGCKICILCVDSLQSSVFEVFILSDVCLRP